MGTPCISPRTGSTSSIVLLKSQPEKTLKTLANRFAKARVLGFRNFSLPGCPLSALRKAFFASAICARVP